MTRQSAPRVERVLTPGEQWDAAKRRAGKIRKPHETFTEVRERHRANPEVSQCASLEALGIDLPFFDREDDEWLYRAARARTRCYWGD